MTDSNLHTPEEQEMTDRQKMTDMGLRLRRASEFASVHNARMGAGHGHIGRCRKEDGIEVGNCEACGQRVRLDPSPPMKQCPHCGGSGEIEANDR